MIYIKTLILILAATLLITFGAMSHASIITVNWSGTVDRTQIAGTVEIGDIITGRYSYDDTARMINGNVHGTGHDSAFSINGLSGFTSNNAIGVFNNHFVVGDQIDTRPSSIGGDYFGDLLGGFSPDTVFVRFNDSTSTALNNTSLPSLLDSANFDNTQSSFLRSASNVLFLFYVDTFSFTSQPANVSGPLTIALFVIGLFGLGLTRRKVT